MAAEHKITFARHPNGRDQIMECSCGIEGVTVRNRTDAENTAQRHLEAAKIKEAEHGNRHVETDIG